MINAAYNQLKILYIISARMKSDVQRSQIQQAIIFLYRKRLIYCLSNKSSIYIFIFDLITIYFKLHIIFTLTVHNMKCLYLIIFVL